MRLRWDETAGAWPAGRHLRRTTAGCLAPSRSGGNSRRLRRRWQGGRDVGTVALAQVVPEFGQDEGAFTPLGLAQGQRDADGAAGHAGVTHEGNIGFQHDIALLFLIEMDVRPQQQAGTGAAGRLCGFELRSALEPAWFHRRVELIRAAEAQALDFKPAVIACLSEGVQAHLIGAEFGDSGSADDHGAEGDTGVRAGGDEFGPKSTAAHPRSRAGGGVFDPRGEEVNAGRQADEAEKSNQRPHGTENQCFEI